MNNEPIQSKSECAHLAEGMRRLEKKSAWILLIICFIGATLLTAIWLMLQSRLEQVVKSPAQHQPGTEAIQISTGNEGEIRTEIAESGRAVRVSISPSVVLAEIFVLPDLSVRARLFNVERHKPGLEHATLQELREWNNAPWGPWETKAGMYEMVLPKAVVKAFDILSEDGLLRPILASDKNNWVLLVDSRGNVRAKMLIIQNESSYRPGLALYDEKGKQIVTLGDFTPRERENWFGQ
jgi:hypothetical protein